MLAGQLLENVRHLLEAGMPKIADPQVLLLGMMDQTGRFLFYASSGIWDIGAASLFSGSAV